MKTKNVIILSMRRCGVSWVMETISQIHKRLFGKPLRIIYEKNRALISNNLIKGYTGVYDIDPKVLLDLGYDKILIIKRKLETIKYAHAKYHGYQELYETYESMLLERPAFFEKIELYHKLLYEQKEVINNPKVLFISLENLNNYTHSTFNEIIDFLEFKMNIIQKIKFFLQVLRNKVQPLVIATNPTERDWDIYSALLPKGHKLCNRLEFLKKINKNKQNIEENICPQLM